MLSAGDDVGGGHDLQPELVGRLVGPEGDAGRRWAVRQLQTLRAGFLNVVLRTRLLRPQKRNMALLQRKAPSCLPGFREER
jgi:hypothetical protein